MAVRNSKCKSATFMPYFTSFKSLRHKNNNPTAELILESTVKADRYNFSGVAVTAGDYSRGLPTGTNIDLYENAQKRAEALDRRGIGEQCDQHDFGDSGTITGTENVVNSVYNQRQQKEAFQEPKNSPTKVQKQPAALKNERRITTMDISGSSSELDKRYFHHHTHQNSKSGLGRSRKISSSGRSISALPTKSFLPIMSRHTNNVSHIKKIQIGAYLIDVWFLSPYPEEYSNLEVLHICEFCLKYMKGSFVAHRHKLKCPLRFPPGDEVYRDGCISIFEVDGRKNKTYCQNLCLLAKMFLDHKTLYYDVEPFLFYIMTETDKDGCHFVGYFSKEKNSMFDYNLSCIMTLPSCQRKGYGQFLIDFSYLLSRREGKVGSPEKPLSDLGLITYRKYWLRTIQRQLLTYCDKSTTLDALSRNTGITVADIITTLEYNNMIERNLKDSSYKVVVPTTMSKNSNDFLIASDSNLVWAPYINISKEDDAVNGPYSTASNNNHHIPENFNFNKTDTFDIIIQQLPTVTSPARDNFQINNPPANAHHHNNTAPIARTLCLSTPLLSMPQATASPITSSLSSPTELSPSPHYSSIGTVSQALSSAPSSTSSVTSNSLSPASFSLSSSTPHPASSSSISPRSTSAHSTPQPSPITSTVRAPTKRTLSTNHPTRRTKSRKLK